MKHLILLSAMLLLAVLCSRAQELKLHPKEIRFLDSLSRAMIQRFGAKEYYELCKNESPVITQHMYDAGYDKRFKHNNGRRYYQVLYPNPDSLKSISLEYRYTAYVEIWQDTKEAFEITFGNGYGFLIPKSIKLEKKTGKKRIMPFETTDFGAIKAQAKEFLEEQEQIRKELYEKEKERLEQEKMKKEQSL